MLGKYLRYIENKGLRPIGIIKMLNERKNL